MSGIYTICKGKIARDIVRVHIVAGPGRIGDK